MLDVRGDAREKADCTILSRHSGRALATTKLSSRAMRSKSFWEEQVGGIPEIDRRIAEIRDRGS